VLSRVFEATVAQGDRIGRCLKKPVTAVFELRANLGLGGLVICVLGEWDFLAIAYIVVAFQR
jgi:hypothetical protein